MTNLEVSLNIVAYHGLANHRVEFDDDDFNVIDPDAHPDEVMVPISFPDHEIHSHGTTPDSAAANMKTMTNSRGQSMFVPLPPQLNRGLDISNVARPPQQPLPPSNGLQRNNNGMVGQASRASAGVESQRGQGNVPTLPGHVLNQQERTGGHIPVMQPPAPHGRPLVDDDI